MRRLLIVYHSQSGNTESLALAALDGARQEDRVETRLCRAHLAGIDDLLWAEALLLGTPENLGYMSGIVKDFFDRTYYPAQGRVQRLPYGVFVSAGNDGTNTVRQIDRIARGYSFRRVVEPVIIRGEVTAAALEASRELGHTLAAGLGFGIY